MAVCNLNEEQYSWRRLGRGHEPLAPLGYFSPYPGYRPPYTFFFLVRSGTFTTSCIKDFLMVPLNNISADL